MAEINEAAIARLRLLASQGCNASALLRELCLMLAAQPGDKLDVIRHMREAFYLSLQEAAPIAGWSVDGTDGFGDDRLDSLLMPCINSNRFRWIAVYDTE